MQTSLDHLHIPALVQHEPKAEPPPKTDAELREEERLEANTLAAACVFVLAIAIDALSSLPAAGIADVPTSLRVTSLVLVSVVAAPPVEASYLFEQRFLALLGLAVASGLALHSAELHARISDAIYCLVGGWSIVGAYAKGGPQRREKGYDAKGQRENVTALAATLLGYAGMRVVRQGALHASEAATFSMEHDDFTTRGLAYADDLVAAMQIFGGCVCVCALVIVLVSHDNIYDHGCAPVSGVVGMLAVVVFTAAFVAQISFFAHVEQLDAIFGDAACEGDETVCATTIRARRMYVANSSPATLWVCAVGMVLLAFPHARRCQTRREYHHGCDEERIGRAGRRGYDYDIDGAATAAGWVALLSALVGLGVVLAFTDSESTLRCVELLLLYGSIPLAWFGTSWIATGVHSAGLLLHVVDKTGSAFGFDLTYLTHWSVLVTLLLLLVLTATMALAQLLYASWCSNDRFIECNDIVTALSLVGLVSIQLLLTLSSLGIVASFGGSNVVLGAQSWPAFGLQWSSQHTLSFFFAAALAGARYEPQHPWLARADADASADADCERRPRSWLGPRALRATWILVPLLTLVAWGIAMGALRHGMPYGQMADLSALAVACVGGLVPWAIVGWWLC